MHWPGRRRGADAGRGAPVPAAARTIGFGIFFAIAATNILTPLLPNITAELGITYTEAGIVVTAYILARLVSSVICGFLADRVPVPLMTGGATLVLVVGSVLGLAATDLQVLVVSRLVSGTGTGVLVTLGLTALGAVAPGGNRARVMSVFQVSHNAGIAVFPIVGGILGAVFGWRSTFVLIAVCAVIASVIMTPVLTRIGRLPIEETEGGHTTPSAGPSRTSLALVVVLVGVFATMFNRHGFRNTALPLYAGTTLGLGPVEISTGIAAMSLVGLAIAVPGAMAGDRFGHGRVIAIGLIALAIGDLTFLLAGDFATFLVASLALGLGDFFIGSQSALVAALVSARVRARALGGFRLATDLGALVGPVALAAVMGAGDASASIVFAAGLLASVGLLTALTVARQRRPGAAPSTSVMRG